MSRRRSNGGSEAVRFKQSVIDWASRIRVEPTEIRLQRMTRKWASCSTAGRITFATALLDQKPSFQQYVIVHELLHLRVPNHGRLFKRYLSAYLPDWRRTETEADLDDSSTVPLATRLRPAAW